MGFRRDTKATAITPTVLAFLRARLLYATALGSGAQPAATATGESLQAFLARTCLILLYDSIFKSMIRDCADGNLADRPLTASPSTTSTNNTDIAYVAAHCQCGDLHTVGPLSIDTILTVRCLGRYYLSRRCLV